MSLAHSCLKWCLTVAPSCERGLRRRWRHRSLGGLDGRWQFPAAPRSPSAPISAFSVPCTPARRHGRNEVFRRAPLTADWRSPGRTTRDKFSVSSECSDRPDATETGHAAAFTYKRRGRHSNRIRVSVGATRVAAAGQDGTACVHHGCQVMYAWSSHLTVSQESLQRCFVPIPFNMPKTRVADVCCSYYSLMRRLRFVVRHVLPKGE